jgi:hypothetical protein
MLCYSLKQMVCKRLMGVAHPCRGDVF